MRLTSSFVSSSLTWFALDRYHQRHLKLQSRNRITRQLPDSFRMASTPVSIETSTPLVSASSDEERVQNASGSSDVKRLEKYDALMEWLRSKGATINDKLVIQPSSRGGGYGAFVTDPVEVGEVLFTIPRAACVTLSDALQDRHCGTSFQRLIEKAGPGANTVVLAGFLARERLNSLHDERADGTAATNEPPSPNSNGYGPYLATLPWERGTNNQEHMLFWSDDDVERYLQGTFCYPEALELRDEVALATKVLQGIVSKTIKRGQSDETTSSSSSGFKWPWQQDSSKAEDVVIEGFSEAVTGAFVCLLTRSFQDGDNDDEKLVPLLDMLQHSDIPNVSHLMQKDNGTVIVTARRSIESGEELLNQYRPELEETMPYHRFFTRFGFVPGIQEPIQILLDEKSSIFFARKTEV